MNRPRITSLAVAVVCLAGCRDTSSRLPVHPVRGEVTVGGRPAAGARLFFHPAGSLNDPRPLRPFAVAGPDGAFRVTSYLSGDGAPTGEYVVTVTWPAKAGNDEPAADQLRGAYADPKMSRLRATVAAGDNVLPPLRLN